MVLALEILLLLEKCLMIVMPSALTQGRQTDGHWLFLLRRLQLGVFHGTSSLWSSRSASCAPDCWRLCTASV